MAAVMAETRWCLMIHGGAGSERIAHDDPAHEANARAGLEHALEIGAKILANGGAAVDAVEAAARALEENACFNAGRGSVLTEHGQVELDAAIMEGRDRRAGAVAGIKTTRAPITLARHLMDHGPHVFLSGEAADRFAAAAGLAQVPNDFFILPERRRQLEEALTAGSAADPIKYGTIGAVAVDFERQCCRSDIDRRNYRKTLGPDRRFPVDRSRHLRRQPLRRRFRDGLWRIFHPRGRRPPTCRTRAARRSKLTAGAR